MIRSYRFGAIIAALVVLLVVPLVLIATRTSGTAHPTAANGQQQGHGGDAPTPPGGAPFFGAQEVTFDQAGKELAFGVALPSTPVASKANLSHVWVRQETQQLGLDFGDGDVTGLAFTTDFTDDGAAYFKSHIASAIDQSEIDVVDGHQVLVISPGTDAYKSNPSSVVFILNGVAVNIYSHSESPSTLLDIVKSMIEAGGASTNSPTPTPSGDPTAGPS